jgi:hypothetical protein
MESQQQIGAREMGMPQNKNAQLRESWLEKNRFQGNGMPQKEQRFRG